MQSSILIRHLLRGGFANATFSYLEKASHRKTFIKKVNAVAVRKFALYLDKTQVLM